MSKAALHHCAAMQTCLFLYIYCDFACMFKRVKLCVAIVGCCSLDLMKAFDLVDVISNGSSIRKVHYRLLEVEMIKAGIWPRLVNETPAIQRF